MKELYENKIGRKLKEGYYSSDNYVNQESVMLHINQGMSDSQSVFQPQPSRFSNKNNDSSSLQQQKHSLELLQTDFIDLVSCYRDSSYRVPGQLDVFNSFMSEIKQNLMTQIVNQLKKRNPHAYKKED